MVQTMERSEDLNEFEVNCGTKECWSVESLKRCVIRSRGLRTNKTEFRFLGWCSVIYLSLVMIYHR